VVLAPKTAEREGLNFMKLTPWTVLIIGICLSAIILCVGFFNYFKPRSDTAANFELYTQKLENEGRKLGAQKKKVEQALELKKAAEEEWQRTVAVKTPPMSLAEGGINLAVNRWQLVLDSIKFRNRIQSDLNQQLRRGGVKVISGPSIPDFPDNPTTILEQGYNYPGYMFPVRVYDLGAVTVEGSLAQIRQNVESWSNMPRYFAVTDGLTITGTPPRLRGTYNLSIAMYIRAKDIYPPVPEGSADASNGTPGVPGAPPAGAAGRGAPEAGARMGR